MNLTAKSPILRIQGQSCLSFVYFYYLGLQCLDSYLCDQVFIDYSYSVTRQTDIEFIKAIVIPPEMNTSYFINVMRIQKSWICFWRCFYILFTNKLFSILLSLFKDVVIVHRHILLIEAVLVQRCISTVIKIAILKWLNKEEKNDQSLPGCIAVPKIWGSAMNPGRDWKMMCNQNFCANCLSRIVVTHLYLWDVKWRNLILMWCFWRSCVLSLLFITYIFWAASQCYLFVGFMVGRYW